MGKSFADSLKDTEIVKKQKKRISVDDHMEYGIHIEFTWN